jgi:hypothetical protein
MRVSPRHAEHLSQIQIQLGIFTMMLVLRTPFANWPMLTLCATWKTLQPPPKDQLIRWRSSSRNYPTSSGHHHATITNPTARWLQWHQPWVIRPVALAPVERAARAADRDKNKTRSSSHGTRSSSVRGETNKCPQARVMMNDKVGQQRMRRR